MRKRIVAALMCACMVCSLMAGCGSSASESATPNIIPADDTETAGEIAGEEEPEDVIPAGMARSLTTGELVTEEEANKRLVGMMVPEDYVAQPGYGTSKAEVVFEFIAESNIPRQLMIFSDWSGMEKWGNIRSARGYFIATAMAWDLIYIHFGGAKEAYDEYLDNGSIEDIDFYAGDNEFFRSSDKNAPHNAYTSTELIEKCIEKHGYSTEKSPTFDGYFKFNTDDQNEIQLDDGVDAAYVSAYYGYSKPFFEYNEETGLYDRYVYDEEEALYDALYQKQLSFKNVILQFTQCTAYFDEQNHDRTEIDIVGSGKGYYCTNGKAIAITWKCAGNGEITHFYDAAGNEITLNQGKTWVSIVDLDDQEKSGPFASKKDMDDAR